MNISEIHATCISLLLHLFNRLFYLFLLKMMLNIKQMMAKMIPTVASKEKITVNAMDTVTVSSFGTPSYGLPSSIYMQHRDSGLAYYTECHHEG